MTWNIQLCTIQPSWNTYGNEWKESVNTFHWKRPKLMISFPLMLMCYAVFNLQSPFLLISKCFYNIVQQEFWMFYLVFCCYNKLPQNRSFVKNGALMLMIPEVAKSNTHFTSYQTCLLSLSRKHHIWGWASMLFQIFLSLLIKQRVVKGFVCVCVGGVWNGI